MDDVSTCRLLFQWTSTIKIQMKMLVWYKADIIIISSKCNLFVPWYGWKIVHLELSNIHSLIYLIAPCWTYRKDCNISLWTKSIICEWKLHMQTAVTQTSVQKYSSTFKYPYILHILNFNVSIFFLSLSEFMWIWRTYTNFELSPINCWSYHEYFIW